MKELKDNLAYLLEMETQQQRLDKLIRQGLMPSRQLPILHRALANIKMGKILAPYEREALSKLLDKMMGFQFGDDVTYNRARLHTQKTKYQTEENTMSEEDVKVFDGSEDEEETKRDKKVKKKGSSKQARDQQKDDEAVTEAVASRPADEGQEEGDQESPKQGGSEKPEVGELCNPQDSKPSIKEGLDDTRLDTEMKFKKISKKIAKKQEGDDVKESILKFNELYKSNLETALANNKVDNVRDIPESIKQDLFKHVEEATYSDKQIKMAKGIAFDKRYKGGNMTGAAKAMEKIKKGLSDHPKASDALRRANEELELPLEEGALKDFALGHGYFENDKEGARKRKDPNWLSKQAASKKTISYKKPKPVKESKMANKDHDGDGKIESGKDEYFGSRDKAIKKALKKVPAMKKEEVEDSNPLPKNPNQAVRDVHKTVADVLAGKSIEVSDEPLVVDPNVELQAELDRTVNVQEGAKEDAMRDMKRDTKGMAPVKRDPKPGKSKHDGSENKGPDHIVSQLRKAISLGDKHDGVKFQDGKTHKVKAHHAHKFLNKYMAGKPADKEKMQSHGHASHDNFKKHID